MFMLPNLSPSISYEVLHTIRSLAPPPTPDTPEARIHRETVLMQAIADLRPGNAAEALLAASIFAANAHATDALSAAMKPNLIIEAVKTYRAQASSMLRHVQSGLRALQRLQAERQEVEAAHALDDSAGEALLEQPSEMIPPRLPAAGLPLTSVRSEAEQYAIDYPGRAATIRAAGGLPKRIDFNAPRRELVQAIVHGTSPILLALDKPRRARMAA